MAAPIKYTDPYYDELDRRTEAKVGLPIGLLSAIRLHGERSNADRVSGAGAKSVYQIIPSTRNSVLKKYGIDANLSAENAAHASALILKEGLDRNGGDPDLAAAEYHGGTDRSQWGPITQEYRKRVRSGWDKLVSALNPISEASADEDITPEVVAEFQAWKEKQQEQDNGYGSRRHDGSMKGKGYLGELKRPDGRVMTEYSIGVNIGGKNVDIPTIVPTLTKEEINSLLNITEGDRIPDSIIQKAVDFANDRKKKGLPFFADNNKDAVSNVDDEEITPEVIAEFEAWKKKKQPQEKHTPLDVNAYQTIGAFNDVVNNAVIPKEPAGDRIGQRMARDITEIGQGTINTVTHPIDTAMAVGSIALGGIQSAMPDSAVNAVSQAGMIKDARPEFNKFTENLAESYGSPERIMKTIHDRPVSSALNAAGIVGLGRNLARAATRPGPPPDLPLVDKWTQSPTASPSARSGGSAGATFAQKAAALGVPDEVQSIIKQAEDGGVLNEIAATRHIEAHSLPVPVSLTEGQALGDAVKISKELNIRGSEPRLVQHFNDQNTALVENLDAIKQKAAPDLYGANHIDDAQEIIDAYKAKDAVLSSDVSAKYKALEEANGGQLPITAGSFVAQASKELAAKMKAKFLPKEVTKMLVELEKTGTMTFEQFDNLRTTLAAEARKYEAGLKADGNRAYAVNIVRNALEQAPINPGVTTKVKALADAARMAAKARFALIKNDPAWQAAIWDKVAPDDFARKFLINGKRQNVITLRNNLADNPTAQQAISSTVIRALTKQAGVVDGAGNFRQSSYNNLLNAIEPKLHDLVDPDIADNLITLGKVAKYTMERPKGAFVNESNTFVSSLADKASRASTKLPVIGPIVDLGLEAKARHAADMATNKSLSIGAGIIKDKQ